MHPLRRLVRLALPLVVVPLLVTTVSPQEPSPTINQSADPILRPFRFRSIGPASMGGRIDDIAVADSDPNIIYLGYATGGVFKSENNGTTFEPVFDTYPTASIGDIAIHPTNPNIVYVGTGEANNRQTSSFGDGIYKTTDGGKTFTNMGLKETQTIARIVIDPKNPETVYVASPGHLFGPNPERGVFKTTDGGKSWNKVKHVDDDTGFTDLAMDPVNTSILYAASYQRRRSGCCFNGGGPGSALWKTTDAGKTWTKLTGPGLPAGTLGRIALDVSRSNPNVVYVQIEAGPTGTPLPGRGAGPAVSTEETPPGAAAVGGAPSAAAAADPAGGARGGAASAAAPVAAAGRGRGGYNWCNNGGPAGTGRGGGGAASSARSHAQRGLPIREQRDVVDARQQLQRAADVLQPASRRSDQRQGRLCRGPAVGEIARWREDVRDAGRGGRERRFGARRSARALDRSEKPEAPPHRQRRRLQHQLGPGEDVGLRQHDGHRARLLGVGGHAQAVFRLRRAPGQRQLGRPERHPDRRHPELRLVRHRRRRRLPDGRRSDRLQHRLHGIAGR